MRKYELIPTNGRKSFYGKAIVCVDDSGAETLYSYGTPIAKRMTNGEVFRLWDGWSATTGNHIKSFCGMNKAEFAALPALTVPPMAADMTPAQSYNAMIARHNAK